MAALPYMQLYVADYLADTMHLDAEEHGAYLLLIMNYWQTGKPILKKRLRAIARVTNDRWPAVEDSLSEYFNDDGMTWQHSRIDADLQMVEEAQSQRSAAGKASAEARKRAKQAKIKRDSNDRSAPADIPLNENSTNKETETDTDTEEKKSTAPKKPKAQPRSLAEKYAAPVEVTRKQWLDYLEARRYKRRPMTAGALELFVSSFERTREQTGLTPAYLIERATEGGWQTLRPDYVTEQPSSRQSAAFIPESGDRFSRLAAIAANTASADKTTTHREGESLEGELA